MVFYIRVIVGLLLGILVHSYADPQKSMNDQELAAWYNSERTGEVQSESMQKMLQQPHFQNLIGQRQIDFFIKKHVSNKWFGAAAYPRSLIELSYPAFTLCSKTTDQLFNFIIGHEIGHIVMGHGVSIYKAKE